MKKELEVREAQLDIDQRTDLRKLGIDKWPEEINGKVYIKQYMREHTKTLINTGRIPASPRKEKKNKSHK